jgi:predicted glycosyltransferase
MGRDSGEASVWIDIENAPQVQYLYPFVEAFGRRGVQVVLTARDYGSALALLRERRASFQVVGEEAGRSKFAKALGAFRRARALASVVRRNNKPSASLSASRASALASRWIGIPSFAIVDYEYANLSVYRFTNSTILHPEVIDSAALRRSGIRERQMVPFHGLKEDISFSAAEDDGSRPDAFSEIRDSSLVRVLFRPPTETSHYYEPESRELALRTLEYLAERPEVVVVYLPRHPWQRADMYRLQWRNDPVVVEHPIEFTSLFESVDLVVCSGGTMLREAAYLGLPAYSILKSRIGAVDRHLASIGRVRLIGSPAQLTEIELRKAPSRSPLNSNPQLLDQLVEIVLKRISRDGHSGLR